MVAIAELSRVLAAHVNDSDPGSDASLLSDCAFGPGVSVSDFVRARRAIDPCLIHTAVDFDDESMSEYLTRKGGADFLENVIAVVYRNLWAWNVEQASKAYFLMIYPHVRNRPSYTFTTGFGTLTRALAVVEANE